MSTSHDPFLSAVVDDEIFYARQPDGDDDFTKFTPDLPVEFGLHLGFPSFSGMDCFLYKDKSHAECRIMF